MAGFRLRARRCRRGCFFRLWPFVPPSQPPPRPQSYHEPASVTLRSGPKLSTLDFRQRGSGSQVRGGSRPPLFSSRKLEGRTSATPARPGLQAADCRAYWAWEGHSRGWTLRGGGRQGAGWPSDILECGCPLAWSPEDRERIRSPLKKILLGLSNPPPRGGGGGFPFRNWSQGPLRNCGQEEQGSAALGKGAKLLLIEHLLYAKPYSRHGMFLIP